MVSNLVDSTNVQNKNLSPSKDFFSLVEEFAQSFEKPKEIYQKIVEIGRNEGFKDTEIDLLVGSYLKGRVHRNTLANYRKEFLSIPEMHKNVQIDDKNILEESSIDEPKQEKPVDLGELSINQEELEPIKPRPDIGIPSKDDWRPPPEQEAPVIIPTKTISEHREEDKQIIEEVVKPIIEANKELKITMSKNTALKFANELRLDVFRLPKDGKVEFIMDMNDESLTYELV